MPQKQKQMQVSAFKARCIEALREVDRTGQTLVVTLRGKPLALVEQVRRGRRLGALHGECEILTDLLHADFAEEWEMNR